MPLDVLMHKILDNACPQNVGVDGTAWNLYWIETHCVGWWITAKKENGAWILGTITAEDC